MVESLRLDCVFRDTIRGIQSQPAIANGISDSLSNTHTRGRIQTFMSYAVSFDSICY